MLLFRREGAEADEGVVGNDGPAEGIVVVLDFEARVKDDVGGVGAGGFDLFRCGNVFGAAEARDGCGGGGEASGCGGGAGAVDG